MAPSVGTAGDMYIHGTGEFEEGGEEPPPVQIQLKGEPGVTPPPRPALTILHAPFYPPTIFT